MKSQLAGFADPFEGDLSDRLVAIDLSQLSSDLFAEDAFGCPLELARCGCPPSARRANRQTDPFAEDALL